MCVVTNNLVWLQLLCVLYLSTFKFRRSSTIGSLTDSQHKWLHPINSVKVIFSFVINKSVVLPVFIKFGVYGVFYKNYLIFQFLRTNTIFNKGRYSRARQQYRFGFFLCIYLNVIVIASLSY